MLEFNLENFVPKDCTGARFEWSTDYREGEYFQAICSDSMGYSKKYTLSKYGEEIITYLDDEQILRKVNRFTCSGNGHIRLNNGKVVSRTVSFIKRDLWEFMQEYGITCIKKFNNEDGDIFIAQNTDKKETRIILPAGAKFNILVDNDNGKKCIYNNYNMPTPCIIKPDSNDSNKYVHCRPVSFIIFDEVIKVNNREFFRRSIVTNASNITKFDDLLDELKTKRLLSWYDDRNGKQQHDNNDNYDKIA